MNPTATSSDAEFDREALPLLPEVARYARSLTKDGADADDLVQDTYLTAYRQWHQFQPGTECRAWLFTICRNRFYRVRLREARYDSAEDPELESLAAAALHASARDAGLAEAFEADEVRQAVLDAIAELPEPFRDVALMVDLNDFTYEAAASAIGVPVGTVRSRLFRARRLLQERLLIHARDAGFGGARPPTHQGSPQ
jgi:RNA polymerase sigma-70 factor (ECF subfamily)